MTAVYRRMLLKISGEGLAGEGGSGISPAVITAIADELVEVHALGVEVSVVVGGGNIIRGATAATQGMDRANADYMGMLAGVINAMALQDAVEKAGVPSRVLTALEIAQVAEPYIRRRAIRHLEKGRLVIFGGGTGNPFFTTDTAAVLRGAEIGADVVLKATQVDGVYDSDPHKNPDAVRYDSISYDEAIQKHLLFMDQAAIALAQENAIPMVVFDMGVPGNVMKVVKGESIGTRVSK